jgi:NitT/TauT family transport system substrate-binding protein
MRSLAFLLALVLFAGGPARAEPIKIGILKVGSSGPVFLADGEGYFAAEGLAPELVYFDSGQAVAVAVVAGAVDVGMTGLTGGLYNLAAKGEMRVLAGVHREAPSFRMLGYFASNRAWAAGLKSLKDLAGHSIAITTVGSTNHYSVALLAEKYGWNLDQIRLLPLQTIPNIVSAVVGGEADAGLIPGTMTPSLVAKDEVKLLGWVGDETPWQIGSVFVATKTADARHDMLVRFLKALGKAARQYHDAFTGPDGKRHDGPGAAAALAIVARYLGQEPDRIENALPYVDPQLRIDANDVQHQIDWYRAQGMLKGPLGAMDLIDRRYAKLMP